MDCLLPVVPGVARRGLRGRGAALPCVTLPSPGAGLCRSLELPRLGAGGSKGATVMGNREKPREDRDTQSREQRRVGAGQKGLESS